MKNFPFIPLIMITTMVMVIIHGHRESLKSAPKAEYSVAAGIDAHLTSARKAFMSNNRFVFNKQVQTATELLSKEAYCDDCIDKETALLSLPPLVEVKHKFERGELELAEMDKIFGRIITSLAKNHIMYTLEHLQEIDDEFYLEDAVRHLKFSMKYADEEVQEKEKAATETLEKALTNHQLDQVETKKVLQEVVSGI